MKNGQMWVGFTQPFTRNPLRHPERLGLHHLNPRFYGEGYKAAFRLVAANNWMRRILYFLNAPRWLTRAV